MAGDFERKWREILNGGREIRGREGIGETHQTIYWSSAGGASAMGDLDLLLEALGAGLRERDLEALGAGLRERDLEREALRAAGDLERERERRSSRGRRGHAAAFRTFGLAPPRAMDGAGVGLKGAPLRLGLGQLQALLLLPPRLLP